MTSGETAAGAPPACSLSSVELRRREAELRELLGGGSLLSVSREGSGALRLELRESPGLRGRLARAVDLERACCPFLDLAIEEADQRIALRIDGPAEAAAVIDGFEELGAQGGDDLRRSPG